MAGGSPLHNANRGLLVVPHVPLDIDTMERPVLFENPQRLVELGQQGWSIGIALIEASNVRIQEERLANWFQGRIGYPAWTGAQHVIRDDGVVQKRGIELLLLGIIKG